MFQSLRINQPFYILTKGQSPKLDIGTVSQVTAPIVKFPSMPQGLGNSPEYIVDVIVSVNGVNQTFQKLPANKEIVDFGEGFGNLTISTSRDAMNNEIATLRNQSENHIKQTPIEEQKLIAYDAIFQQLNPEFAEKQKQEAEIVNLKNQVAALTQTNTNLEQMMSQILSEIKSKKSKD